MEQDPQAKRLKEVWCRGDMYRFGVSWSFSWFGPAAKTPPHRLSLILNEIALQSTYVLARYVDWPAPKFTLTATEEGFYMWLCTALAELRGYHGSIFWLIVQIG